MDAKTRADVRRLVQYALDTASTCHAAECEHVEVAAIAGRVRAALDAPAETTWATATDLQLITAALECEPPDGLEGLWDRARAAVGRLQVKP